MHIWVVVANINSAREVSNSDKYSIMDQVKFMKDSLQVITFTFFKDCLLQILLGPFLNTLTQLYDGIERYI